VPTVEVCALYPTRNVLTVDVEISNCVVSLLNGIQGVFKKRLNFLYSAPTSTEGALRLLSAPSGRF
jgi:hypothetical protein